MSTQMMRAVRFHRYGPPQELVLDSIPRPASPAEGQVLVRVHYAGVNYFDVSLRAGLLQKRLPPIPLPAIPGVELSGTIEELGAGVTSFEIGQPVYCQALANFGSGSSAEYILLPAQSVFRMARNLDFAHAATVVHGARTAWSGLFEYADLQPGQRLLVQGGPGGVGMYAIQLAHLKGAHVIGTGSADNLEFMREMGADEVIDYTKTNFEDVVSDVDMVFDNIGGETMERSWQVLKKGGILVSATGFPSQETADRLEVRCARIMFPKDAAFIIKEVTAMVEAGKLKPHIRKIFPMEQAVQAHELCETRHGRGRIVLHIAD